VDITEVAELMFSRIIGRPPIALAGIIIQLAETTTPTLEELVIPAHTALIITIDHIVGGNFAILY
jgi:hypothetical protein